MEVNKAFKRRIAREKKKQEKIDLAPAQNLQPKSRSIRYDNMKSAMAEELLRGFWEVSLKQKSSCPWISFSLPFFIPKI